MPAPAAQFGQHPAPELTAQVVKPDNGVRRGTAALDGRSGLVYHFTDLGALLIDGRPARPVLTDLAPPRSQAGAVAVQGAAPGAAEAPRGLTSPLSIHSRTHRPVVT